MRTLATKARAINQYNGLGNQLWDLAGNRPSLDLPFADNKSLVDATTGANLVDFTRASSGTYVDSEGVIRTATTNLLLRSEDLTVSPWTTVGSVTVTADSSQGLPFTGASVYRIDYLGTPTQISHPFTYLATNYTASVWVKGTAGETIRFAGQATVEAENYTLTGEWQRLTQAWTATASAQTFNLNTSAGATARTIYVAAPQLEKSTTVGEYIPTTSTINSAPRFDHDPTTGESLGLLVEEQRTNSYIPTSGTAATRAADVASISGSNFGVSRTNLLLRSEEFDNASWNSAAGARTITPNSVAAPDGLLTADTFAADGTTNAHFVSQSLTLSAVPYAYSVFAKAGTNNFLQLRTFNAFGGMWANFDLATGVVGTVGFVSGAAPTSSIQAYPNGWYRCTMLFTPTATTSSVAAYIVNSASAGGSLANSLSTTLYLWGAQLETGSTATAYIPTTTAAVTVVESPWYRQDEGTVFTEFNRPAAVTGLRSIAAVSDGGYNNRMTLRTDSAVFMNSFVTTGGVNQATFPLAINSGANNKAALAYATNDFNAGVNGVSGTNDTVGTVPVVDRLSIGSVLNAEPSCSYVRRLTYWPARLPNETLQTITQ
jgi:hypothetical protein